MRPLLRLIRFPLFVTALADSAAGYLLAVRATADISPATLLLLAGASAFLYCAGMALNDVADRERDRALHPGRPIPAGAVTTARASTIGVAMLATGLACAMAAGAADAATLVILLILLYNFALKRSRLAGAATMGLVRAGNMAMGMTAARPLPEINEFDLAWAGILFLYVTLTTLLSTLEEGRAPRVALVAILAAVAAPCVAPALASTHLRPESVAFAAILVAALAARAVALMRRPTAAEISATVGVLVLGIVPLDASILLGLGMPMSALAVLLLLPAAMLASWSFKRG